MERALPHDTASAPMRVVVLNWRDTYNPEGGGAELYVESVARGLAAQGHDVTMLCAGFPGGARRQDVDGVQLHRGGNKLTVYPTALLRLWRRRRTTDVVIDVQNGVPFFSRLVTRRPVVVLVHHVHREQWPVVYGPIAARVGWWLESRLSPRIYRGCQYVTVSEKTREELVELGVARGHVSVVHNGTDQPAADGPRSESPTLCVLGRLVPHKRVEHALAVAAELRGVHPGLRLTVMGDGWWSERLRAESHRLAVADLVTFTGFVAEQTKHRLLAASWVHLAPSLKEGWGLNVMEAASHGVPTVAYRSAGGLSESVVAGGTGLLAEDYPDFRDAVHRLLADSRLRRRLGDAARLRSQQFQWSTATQSFEWLLTQVTGGNRVCAVDPGAAAVAATPPRSVRDAVTLQHRRVGADPYLEP